MIKHKHVFSNKRKLELMLRLRKEGWTYHSLGFVFGVDYTSIYGECKKFNVKKEKENVDLSVRSILTNLGIRARKVKSYEDYLMQAGYKKPQVFLEESYL